MCVQYSVALRRLCSSDSADVSLRDATGSESITERKQATERRTVSFSKDTSTSPGPALHWTTLSGGVGEISATDRSLD